jgi:IMP dehydrogenase
MQNQLTFDDVLIAPCFSTVASRREVDLSSHMGSFSLKLPVFSSNMDTVTGATMANVMAKAGACGLLHRFMSIEENVQELKRVLPNFVGVSVGLGDQEFERACALVDAGASFLVLDVAHAAQISVVQQSRRLREKYSSNIHISVGTFANSRSINDWLHHGGEADSLHVGIGPGSACSTRIKTGVGIPQLSALIDCAKSGRPIISNGGCKTPGDIAKAIAAGAHGVILGGMLAGTDEAPGELIEKDSKVFKKYRGSASLESYEVQNKKAEWRTAEGESMLIPYKGSVNGILQDIEGGLRSSFSYVGARNIEEFKRRAELVTISSAAFAENGAHGKKDY